MFGNGVSSVLKNGHAAFGRQFEDRVYGRIVYAVLIVELNANHARAKTALSFVYGVLKMTGNNKAPAANAFGMPRHRTQNGIVVWGHFLSRCQNALLDNGGTPVFGNTEHVARSDELISGLLPPIHKPDMAVHVNFGTANARFDI